MNLSPYSNVDRIVVGSGPKGKVERPKHKADQVRNKKKTQKSSSKLRGSPHKSLVKKSKNIYPSYFLAWGIVSHQGEVNIEGVKKCKVYQLRRIGQEMKLVMSSNMKKPELQNLIISSLNSKNRGFTHRRNNHIPIQYRSRQAKTALRNNSTKKEASTMAICFWWKKGRCLRGTRCRFKHLDLESGWESLKCAPG